MSRAAISWTAGLIRCPSCTRQRRRSCGSHPCRRSDRETIRVQRFEAVAMKPFVWVAAAVFAALASPAAAQQRPLVTEDPETIGSGLVLIEGGFNYENDILFPVSGLEGNLIRLPTVGLSFGLSSI